MAHRGDPAVVQRYLLARLERDEAQERAARAEQERIAARPRAEAHLRDRGPVVTQVNNGPQYTLWYEAGSIQIKKVESLHG